MNQTTSDLITGLRKGDRRSLARAITLVESTRPDDRTEAVELLDAVLDATGASIRIGVTGPPGVGKSTFIEAFGLHILSSGHRLAVLAIDPSSARTGGSILGDKTRMGELSAAEGAFIRPSPGGGRLGGVARRTREAMLLCEAAGFDVVVVETVGVGQSETEVAGMVDMFVLLVSPGGGDELQGIKRGIMELADLVVVNKADGDLEAAAGRTCADYANAVHLLQPKWTAWQTRALQCSAMERRGIDEVWAAVIAFRDSLQRSGEFGSNRARQAIAWLWSEVDETLLHDFKAHPKVRALAPALERAVAAGETSPTAAARKLLNAFRQ
ncbi:MAG: methylmalonyl Co-A mutase-associated GTPase MeaB [Acidimicrobiales bacterium]|nr:methylmalonyl Co-A mutase-associated GTPase MeaB [Acidimicrobiales bacterium]